MNESNRYALFKLKQVFLHPYAWLIIIVSNAFSILSIKGFNETLSSYGIDVPGPLFMIYLMGNWKFVTYGFLLLSVMFFILYYQRPGFDQQLTLRLGGRNLLFIGRLLSFFYVSFAFFLSTFILPITIGFIIGNSESGWGYDIFSLSQSGENETEMIHSVIQALTENTSFIEHYSPVFVMIVHFILLYLTLMILVLLLDIGQHLLKSLLWTIILIFAYIFFFVLAVNIPEVGNLSFLTLQANSVILFKVTEGSGEYLSYGYSISFFILIMAILFTFSYWKERYSCI